jgi:hypothetical protein
MNTRITLPAALGLAALLLAAALASSSVWPFLWVPIAISAACYVLRARAAWVPYLGLTAHMLLAAYGLALTAPVWPTLLSCIAALAAWDLTHFDKRMQAQARFDAPEAQQRAHLQHLGGVLGIGLLIASAALLISVPIPFGWLAALLLAALLLARWGLRAAR